MQETIEELKQRLRKKYIGKAGIHGLGIDRSQNALRIYHVPEATPEQNLILEEIKKEAHPFKVLTVKEDQPKIT